MSTKAEQIKATIDSLVTQCKAANTFAEVVGLGRSNIHGSALDSVVHGLSAGVEPASAIDTLQAYSDMLAAWVGELRIKASRELEKAA
jgi:hypothetical protein